MDIGEHSMIDPLEAQRQRRFRCSTSCSIFGFWRRRVADRHTDRAVPGDIFAIKTAEQHAMNESMTTTHLLRSRGVHQRHGCLLVVLCVSAYGGDHYGF
jgi:hypothetical protein